MIKTLNMIRTGCQGWNYTDWITKPGGHYVFYPEGSRSKDMLSLYSSVFDTVEVDSTFYAIPPQSTFEAWYERSDEEFLFSLKLPGEITHQLRLGVDSYGPFEAFCERALTLKEKLGIVLIQLPPAFKADRDNARELRTFVRRLPQEIRFAVEFRDADWLKDWTFDTLAENGASVCAVEGEWIPRNEQLRWLDRHAGLHLYVRFMGARDLERFDRVVRPDDGLVRHWHDSVTASGREAFVYFSNLFEGFAPASVNSLREMTGQGQSDPAELRVQGRLF